jgi:hypothetical protein
LNFPFQTNFEIFLGQECGLSGIFNCKDGDTREGVATFYNPSKFKLLETTKIIVKEFMTTLPFYKSFSHMESLVERISERNTVLQVSVFEFVNSPDSILIVGEYYNK